MEITKSNHDSKSGRVSCSALYTPVFGMSGVCMCLVYSLDTLV